MGAFEARIAAAASIMPDLMQEAIALIDGRRFACVAERKDGLDGRSDIVTDVDRAAQELLVSTLRSFTPDFGVVAEEDGYSRPSRVSGHNVYWTVDGVDGSWAMSRGQSHGIGSMLALVADGAVVAACIGDVCSKERYFFGPGEAEAWRLRPDGTRLQLCPLGPQTALADTVALIGQRESQYPPVFQHLLRPVPKGGLFRDLEIDRGSIGLRLARLWKGEVGAYAMRAYYETPWDHTPIIGFCQRLGFTFLKYKNGPGRFEAYEPTLRKTPKKISHDTLIVHNWHREELRAWEDARRNR